MAHATTVDLLFCCPNCGADLRASRRDSGSVLDCQLCGEHVRVPHQPHPVESPEFLHSLSAQTAWQAALQGLRFLMLSIGLILAEYLLICVAYALWTQADSLPQVMRRQTTALGGWLLLFWWMDLFLMFARSGCRWWGYAQLEPAGRVIGSRPWIEIARYSTLLRGVGYCLMVWPWLTQAVWPLTGGLAAINKIGQFAWMTGSGLEFTILIFWYQLLRQLDSITATRVIVRYALWTGFGLFLTAVGVTLVGMLLVVSIRTETAASPHPPVRPIEFPESIWTTAAVVMALVGVFWLYLVLLYYLVLVRVRRLIQQQATLGSD